ncbi:hypothetical protein [Leucobacter sp. 7(1)]|uniref:hypothetical protein n=1 Tax=Leucobacter sp. 7(1) TaxID=1255613 RepID=UPI00111E8ABB|nr:hypothetical protein [Leucobacter sp. 7(1)]
MIDELGSWSKERMYADEQRRRISKGTPAWQLAGYQEFTGSGKLRLRQGSPPSGYGNPTFGDRKIVRLEERITESFVRFEVWRLEEAHREEQRRLEKECRHHAWEAAMAQARIDYVEHAKWEHFKELSQTSGKIDGHRRFLEHARLASEALPEVERQAAIEYLSEMEATIDAIDPLAMPKRLVPKIKKPRDSDLGPFLDGWSPYGPR